MARPLTFEEICGKVVRYCSYQERSLNEIRLKLRTLGCPRDREDELIEFLEQEGYYDNERYARAFVRGKFRMKGWGKLKLKAALFQKGIDAPLIDLALEEEIEWEEYLETAKKAFMKKRAFLLESNKDKKRDKLFAYMVSRGFEGKVIRDLMEGSPLEND